MKLWQHIGVRHIRNICYFMLFLKHYSAKFKSTENENAPAKLCSILKL